MRWDTQLAILSQPRYAIEAPCLVNGGHSASLIVPRRWYCGKPSLSSTSPSAADTRPSSDPSPPRTVRARRLDGIMPNKVGIPQVVVTLQLDEAFKLRVTALDKQRNHSRSLVCKEVK